MRQEGGEVEGNVIIDEEFELTGMVVGSVTVVAGGTFHLNGTVTGDLTLRSGAVCDINGTVGGSVFNRGGNLRIYGVVKGTLRRDGGNTYIDEHAQFFSPFPDPNFR